MLWFAIVMHACGINKSKPCHVERYKTRVTPLISDQLRELALEAGYIFFGEMQALHGDDEQIHGKNCGGIVFPASCDPEQGGFSPALKCHHPQFS